MLGAPLRIGVPWPGSGEVDILEDINGRSSTFGTLHCGTLPGGPCNESTGIGSGERACSGCQTAYHTYAVEIDRSVSPEQIRWYLDGVNYYTLSASQIDATAWATRSTTHSSSSSTWPSAEPFRRVRRRPHRRDRLRRPTEHRLCGRLQQSTGQHTRHEHRPGQSTTASSAESTEFPASNATDGNVTTRWSSTFSDPQWLQVDLGQSYPITHVTVTWEAACASAYQVQTSADGATWTTIYTNNSATGGIQDISATATGRYVRIYATARASTWGDSLYEVAVYSSTSSGGSGRCCHRERRRRPRPPRAPASRRRARSTVTPAPVGRARSPTRSGCRSTWAPAIDQPGRPQLGNVVRDAFQVQTSTDGTAWTNIYSTTTSTGGVQTLR